jgi:hypothetical protein
VAAPSIAVYSEMDAPEIVGVFAKGKVHALKRLEWLRVDGSKRGQVQALCGETGFHTVLPSDGERVTCKKCQQYLRKS